jgi:2-dehydropantoate 2-reductase
MKPRERCWIIGASAVGSVLAAVLHQNEAIETYLVGRSVHVKEVEKKGLLFETVDQEPSKVPVRAVSPDRVPPLRREDLVLMTGKAPALEETCLWLRPNCGPHVRIIVLQNGMGADAVVARALGRPVDRGLIFFGAHSPLPGRVRYFPGSVRLQPSAAAESLCELLKGSAVKCEAVDNFKEIEWFKLVINCIANPLAGVLNASSRQIAKDVLAPAKETILAEVRQVAGAEGVSIDITLNDINRYIDHDNFPSMTTDLKRGIPTEIDFINGAVVRFGKRHGIPTPVNEVLLSLIKYLEKSANP